MVDRRPAAPRKRTAPAAAVGIVAPAADGGAGGTASRREGSLDPQKMASELLGQIDDLLRNQPSIGQEDREAFNEHFGAALRKAVDAGDAAGSGGGASLQDSVEQLKRYAAEVDDGSNELVRRLNDALAPLERRETKIALEFSRRLQADGQESAMSWLREQQQATEQDAAGANQVVPDRNRGQPTRDDVTKSRSRRLRGPPMPK